MSSLLAALSIAQSGLSAVSTQLEVVSSNVSNAGTEGYTKKGVVLASAALGEIGGGTSVVGFTRNADAVLFRSLSQATSNASYRETQNSYLQQIMDTLGLSSSDNPPLSDAVTTFVNAWTALQAEPESSVTQQEVINSGSTLADEIHDIAANVEEADRQISNEIGSSLQDLNNYLIQIGDLNVKISNAQTGGMDSGDLEDVRDQLVLKVANLLNVTTLDRGHGQIALYTKSGYQLLDGSSINSFSYDGANIVSNANLTFPLNNTMSGGSLEALTKLRDTSATAAASADPGTGVIQKLRDQLDLVARSFLSTVTTATSGEQTFAAAYNAGATAAGELGANFFTGTNRTDFSINAALLAGTAKIKADGTGDVVSALLDETRVFNTSGLTANGVSYASLVSASMTDFQQTANTLSTLNTAAANMVDFMTQKYSNKAGVNVDEEMIALVTLQNVYTANARVLSVVQELFTALQNTV